MWGVTVYDLLGRSWRGGGMLTCEVGWEAFFEGGDMGEEGHGGEEVKVEVHGGCGGGGKFDIVRRRM